MSGAAFLSNPLAGPSAGNVNYLGAARCRRRFERFYPDGFVDHTYLVAERAAKERAHLEWRNELGPGAFRKLLARGEYRQIADAAVRIEARTQLLFSFERMALRDAVKTPAGARLFATELYALLWGGESTQRRFQDWLLALDDLPRRQARVISWPLATVFGFIARPDRHLFMKPRVTQRAAHAYGYDLGYEPRPSWDGYRALQTFGTIIRRDLDRHPGFKARDLIDIQSFIWVQGAAEYDC